LMKEDAFEVVSSLNEEIRAIGHDDIERNLDG